MIALLIALAVAPAPSAAERGAIFKAAGFAPRGGRYLMCDGRTPLGLEVRDINGDGRRDALVIDGGLECYGHTEAGFVLLTYSPQGRWTVLHQTPGVANFLRTRANGWPDLEVGGPGFCFPVLRWTGRAYVEHRTEYQGRPCSR